MNQALKKPKPSAVRQVRAVGVCRPPGPWDSRRYSSSAAAASEALTELDISDPAMSGELPADAPDAGLCRDIAVGADTVLRMPLYGHRGAAAELLCEQEVAPLLRRLLSGESAAVIAYGQTGSGKSHTMGTEKCEEGSSPARHSVSAFCAEGMFALARECGVKELEVSLAAVEIYREGQNERLFDLQTLERKRIASFEQQASWQRAASAQDLQRKLQEAAFLRSTDRTDGNARSSRSHAIFVTQVQFKRWYEGAAAGGSVAASGGGGGATGGDGGGGSGGGGGGGGWQRIKARLMLVDLAGSERAALAQAGSSSQKQGSGINVGLLFLGMVINELAERGETKNYAFSCLTKILKPALGGGSNEVTSSCNTLILGCIDPLALHLANTRSTLEFLQSAGTIKNVVRADVQMLRQQELAAEVEDLRRQLRGMQLQLSRHPHLQLAGSGGGSDTAAAAGAAAGRDDGSIGLVPQAEQGSASAGGGGGKDAAVSAAAATAAAAAAMAADERVAALEAQLAASRAEAASLRMSLVVERDRAEAYEAVLRQQESGTAAAAVAAAGGEAAAATAARIAGTIVTTASAAGAGEMPGTAGMHPGAAGTATTIGAAAAAAATPTPPSAAARPFAALMAASPLLAASRDVAEWVADAAAVQAATPAGEHLPLLRLLPGAEEVCCDRESHMGADELAALKTKVERLLVGAQAAGDREQALAFAEACLYSLLAYNSCLGAAVTRAEDAAEDLQAAVQQQEAEFMQLYQEKVQYMRRTAAAEIGLAEYETQVERLQARLAAAHKALEQQAEAQQGTPGRWGSIGRLLSGSSRSPAAAGGPAASPGGGGEMAAGSGGGGGGGSLRSSSSGGSPDGTPRGGIVGGGGRPQQQLFGSPSPLGKQQQKGQQGRQQPEVKQQQQHRQLQDQQQQGQQQQGQQQEDQQQHDQQQQQQRSDQEQQQSDQLEDQPLQDQQQQDEQAQQAQRQAPAADNQAGLLLEAGQPSNLSNLTVASLRLSLEQQEQAHAAAATSFLAAKQRQAAAALAGSGSGGEQAEVLLIKAAGRHSGTAGLPPAAPEEQSLSAQLPCKPLPGLGLPTQQQQQQQQQEQEQMQQEGEQVGLTAQPTAALQQAVEQGAAEREVSELQEREGVGARAVHGHVQAIDTQRAQQAQQPQQQVQAQQADQVVAAPAASGLAQHVLPSPKAASLQLHSPQAEAQPPPQVQQAGSRPEATQQHAGRQPEATQQQAGRLTEATQQQAGRQPEATQQQAGRQTEATQQLPAVLPGPGVAVMVPMAGSGGGKARGRARKAAAYQEFDLCPATGTFTLPGSDEAADPLTALCKVLSEGQPWQRHVCLKAPGLYGDGLSGITVESWLARRMLRPGLCHFCCKAAPDPSLRHPEPAFSELRLCESCHDALEPDSWKTGEAWQSSDPSDPGFLYCCLCGAAGVGSTDQLLMCSSCVVCGFCSGCMWRFSSDDLATLLHTPDARFTCLLCRPEPRLQLLYASDDCAGSEAAPHTALPPPNARAAAAAAAASGRGSRQGGGKQHAPRAAAAARQAAEPAAEAVGERKQSSKPVKPQRVSVPAAPGGEGEGCGAGDFESPDPDFCINLSPPSGDSSDEGEEQAAVPHSSSNVSSSSGEDYQQPCRSCPSQQQQQTSQQRWRPDRSGAAPPAPKQQQQQRQVGQQPSRKQQSATGKQASRPSTAAAARGAAAGGALAAAVAPSSFPALKRNRLLARGDLVTSPASDGERPALQRQRLQQQQQQQRLPRQKGSTAAAESGGSGGGGTASQVGGSARLTTHFKDLLHL